MNYFKTAILLIVLTLLLVWIGGMLGGPRGAAIAFVVALIINGISFWFSDKIILKMYNAQELDSARHHHLYDMVKNLTDNSKLPMPKLYMMDQQSPNAFATGRDPDHACLCVTRGLLELLNENELKGVLAHELAHVKNHDTLIMTVTASIAGAIMMLASLARWTAILGAGNRGRRGGNIFGLIAISIIAPIATLIVQLAISRQREYVADRSGSGIAGDSKGLADALYKLNQASKRDKIKAVPQTAHLFITNPLSGDFVSNLFSTHPSVKDRIARLNKIKL